MFVTEQLVSAASPQLEAEEFRRVIVRCRDELEQVHLHMEDAGVSSALVYDLLSIEASLGRMELLAAVLVAEDRAAPPRIARCAGARAARRYASAAAVPAEPDAAARKTVERTGHGGEHYVARDRSGYWKMWRAAAGGGLLTVLTAAIKSQLVGAHLPLFVEGFLIGTDYAVTFVLLHVFHFALATKQPSMTAAALAGIIRSNRGEERWNKISGYAAQITRTSWLPHSAMSSQCASAGLPSSICGPGCSRITFYPPSMPNTPTRA
ncbi:MAG: hypothetical protein WDM77_01285 [Steroidobacteraceae bacterium]